jgi:hypothetical protein
MMPSMPTYTRVISVVCKDTTNNVGNGTGHIFDREQMRNKLLIVSLGKSLAHYKETGDRRDMKSLVLW